MLVRKYERQEDSGDNYITWGSGDHFYRSPNFIREIKSRGTEGAGTGKSKSKVHPITVLEDP